jgi:hypothetical protein
MAIGSRLLPRLSGFSITRNNGPTVIRLRPLPGASIYNRVGHGTQVAHLHLEISN